MEGTKNNFTDRLENRKTHLSSSPILFRTINRLHYAFKPVKKLSILPVVQVPHKTISAVQQNHPATHPLHFTEKTMGGVCVQTLLSNVIAVSIRGCIQNCNPGCLFRPVCGAALYFSLTRTNPN